MITLRQISKRYPTRHGEVTVLDGIDLDIKPGDKLGILGRNGSGKSTLIRIISGAERPTHGLVDRQMSVSWPLAFGGAFQGSLTGYDNLRFICRIYGVDAASRVAFVEDFCELGRYLREPMKTYSSGMRTRLAFAISMAIEFDCYLIDEVIAVGDSRFHEKCKIELFEKRKDRAMVIVSHQAEQIVNHCTTASVLHGGRLHRFDSVAPAYEYYQAAALGAAS